MDHGVDTVARDADINRAQEFAFYGPSVWNSPSSALRDDHNDSFHGHTTLLIFIK